MTDQVQVTIAALATICRQVTGVKRAYEFPPLSVPSTELVAAVILPGESTPTPVENSEAYAEFYLSRLYYVNFLVAPWASGVSGEAYNKTVPFIEAGLREFMSYPFLGTGNAFRVTYAGDTGVRDDLVYADTRFYGVRFKLNVTTRLLVELDE